MPTIVTKGGKLLKEFTNLSEAMDFAMEIMKKEQCFEYTWRVLPLKKKEPEAEVLPEEAVKEVKQ